MRELTVQIERLQPLRVATLSITSESPEEEAIHALLEWARPQGLLNQAFRFFGYDNCQPSPNHTYTTWLTVGTDVKPSGAIEIRDFPGGLFAAIEVQGVEQITPGWQQLVQWCEDSDYQHGEQIGLEEHMDVTRDIPLNERYIKLYLSVKPRNA